VNGDLARTESVSRNPLPSPGLRGGAGLGPGIPAHVLGTWPGRRARSTSPRGPPCCHHERCVAGVAGRRNAVAMSRAPGTFRGKQTRPRGSAPASSARAPTAHVSFSYTYSVTARVRWPACWGRRGRLHPSVERGDRRVRVRVPLRCVRVRIMMPNTGSMGGAHPTRITWSGGVVLECLFVAARHGPAHRLSRGIRESRES